MNVLLIATIALCLAGQAALGQYRSSYGAQQQSYGATGGYQQRKLAPTPQVYAPAASSYGAPAASSYAAPAQTSYRHQAPSSAAYSSYDKRSAPQTYAAPAQTYAAPAQTYSAPKASTYVAKQSYAAPQQSYAAPAQSYAAPAQTYAAPAQSYAAPAQSYAAPAQSYAAPQTSYASKAAKYEEPYYPPMPFAWGYDINDGYGGAQYHKESGDEYGKRTGSYGYTDAHGVYRQVDYVADENGFRASIKTNEPGTANESPADVELHAYEPPSNYYAGQSSGYSSAPASGYAAAAPAAYGASNKGAAY